MSEFMLISGHPTPADPADSLAACRDPAEIARQLIAALAALDAIGAGMAAAYLAMALDALPVPFNPGEDSSGTD